MTYSAEVLADSPLVYWRMGDASGTTVADSSGNSRNGTYTGSPGLGTAGLLLGDADTAVDFDGTDDKAEIAYASWMDVGSTLTIEAWVNTTATGAREIAARYTNNPNRQWDFRVTSGVLVFIKIAGGTVTSTGVTTVNDGNPHHVVATYDGSNIRLYVDGVLDQTTAATGTMNGQLSRFVVGERAADTRFDGIIDEVAMYGTVLSGARILAHYEAGLGNIAIAGEAFASAATMLDGTAQTQVLVAGDAFASAATMLDGTILGNDITVSGDPFTSTTSMLDGSAQTQVLVVGDAFAGAATMLDGTIPDPPIISSAFAVAATMLDGTITQTSTTDTSNSFGGLSMGGSAAVTVTIPIATGPASAPVQVDLAVPFPEPTLVKGRPTNLANVRALSTEGCTDRVLVGGKDITQFRATDPGDTPTAVPPHMLTEPFGYGPSQPLVIPRTNSSFERHGTGDLKWLKQGASVRYQRVKPNGDIVTDYRGVILAIHAPGDEFTCDVGGEYSGRAALINKPPVLTRKLHDLGEHLSYAVRVGAGITLVPRQPVTGLNYPAEGDTSLLSWAQKLGALSQTANTNQRALMPITWGGTRWSFSEKDRTTKDLTLFADGARVKVDLVDDATEQPNTIFGSGVSPDGERWGNRKYPNLIQGPAPDYPIAGGAAFGVGTTDADTVNGDGISIMKTKLSQTNYLSYRYATGDTYTSQVATAVNRLLEDAGLSPLDGEMTVAGWNALYSIDIAGYHAAGATVLPIAQTSARRAYNRASNGAVLSRNPNYVPSGLRVDRTIDYGVCEASHAASHARSVISATAGHQWDGTITLTGVGAFIGEHDDTDWDTLDASDIMPARSIRPGMNAWLPYFDGGTLVHISQVDVRPATGDTPASVVLSVSSAAKDFYDLAQALKRNQESRRNIYREYKINNLGVKPTGNFVSRDEWFGRLWQDVTMSGGTWNIVPVVMGQSGTVNRTDIRLVNDAAEFCIAVFTKKMTAYRLNTSAGSPFVYDDDGLTAWERDEMQQFFESQGLLYVAGQGDQPGGYGWRKGYDADGNRTVHPLTGTFVDDSTWSYGTDPGSPMIGWVAIYPEDDCVLQRGHLLFALEDDVT